MKLSPHRAIFDPKPRHGAAHSGAQIGAPPVVGPTVTINQASGQGDPPRLSPVEFDVVFSEAVTGFTDSDVVLSGTAGTMVATVTNSGDDINYTVSVAADEPGTVIASIPAGVATSIATSAPNTPSTSTDHTITIQALPFALKLLGPLLYWIRDGSDAGIDYSGNANDGADSGVTHSTVPGMDGYSYATGGYTFLDGIQAHVDETGAATVFALINRGVSTSLAWVALGEEGGSSTTAGWQAANTVTGISNSRVQGATLDDAGGTYLGLTSLPDYTMPSNTWVAVCWRFYQGATSPKICINGDHVGGTPFGTGSGTQADSTNTNDVLTAIGRSAHVAVYDYELSDSFVDAVMFSASLDGWF